MNHFHQRGVGQIGPERLAEHTTGGIFETCEELRPQFGEQYHEHHELQAIDEVLGRGELSLAAGFEQLSR